MSRSQPGSATAAAAAAMAAGDSGAPEVAGWQGQHEHAAAGQAAAGEQYGSSHTPEQYGHNAAAAGGSGFDPESGADAADAAAYDYAGHEAAGEVAGVPEEVAQASEAAAAATYSPADYLHQLEQHLRALQQQRLDLQQQLAAAAAAAYQDMSGRLGTASTGVPLPPDVPALAGELAVLHSVRQYLAYVQELQALTRHAEKAIRSLQQQQAAVGAEGAGGGAAAAGEAAEPAGFLQSLSEAVDGYSNAVGYAIAVAQLTEQGKVPIERLQQFATSLLSRLDAVQRGLRGLLSAAIQRRLAAAHWPPPLTVSGDGSAATGAADGGAAWHGFAAVGEAAAGELQHLLVVLLTLQRASQHEKFSALTEASQEGPLLWVAEELAAPLAERLRHHFASGLPTDRPDRPEWLFATALKAARQCAPLAQELQPCIDAHQLQSWYSMPLEVARAVQAVGVNALVANHLLPQLVEAADTSLWLHLADEAMQFEKRFSPLRGASLAVPEDEEFLAAAHSGSTIELLFQRPEWQEGWLGAELWDASRQLDAACDAYSAWQPAAQQLLAGAGLEEDMVPDTPRSRGGAAWRREFWPPVCAEQVASLIGGLVRRGGWVHEQAHKRLYMQAVPLAVLRAFRERLTNLLLQAEQFRGMLSDTWLPRVGAAICASHFTEHQLREPQGVLLLVELQDTATAGVAGAAADGIAGTAGAAGGAAVGGADAAPQGRSLAALFEREASAFGSLRKQWAYKLAKLAVDRFHQLFAPYKRDGGAFTLGYDESQSLEQQEAAAADVGPASPSPAMLLAADSLQQLLRALAQHLDAVVFRDVWKSVALAVNYSVYNEVATEALFSAEGAAQLDADLSAMSAVFGEYTSRPAAHFKESREACRLLQLPYGHAAQLLAELEAQPQAAKQVLAQHGIKVLNAEQAAVVLLQRLDVLTGRAGRGGGGHGGGVAV